jgi:hypothetical protein
MRREHLLCPGAVQLLDLLQELRSQRTYAKFLRLQPADHDLPARTFQAAHDFVRQALFDI